MCSPLHPRSSMTAIDSRCRGAEHERHTLRMQLNAALGILVQHQVHSRYSSFSAALQGVHVQLQLHSALSKLLVKRSAVAYRN